VNSLKFFLFTLLVTAAACPAAFAIGETKAQWKAVLYGRSTDDTFSSSKTVGVAAVLKVQSQLADDLEARFVGIMLLETGSASSLFTNEFEPHSRFNLQEASLRWHIWQPFSFLAGAIDQRHQGSPLVVDGGTFPAAMLAADFGSGGWIFHGDAQAAIPTSRTLSVRSSAGKEPTPTLFTQKAVVGWEDKAFGFKGLYRVTHFQYGNFTSGITQDSRFYGNTVVGVGLASRFLYKFEGIETGPDFVIPLGPSFSWRLGASFAKNFKGPVGDDEGRYAYTSLLFKAPTFTLTPGLEYFRAETDVAPAFYNSPGFGHNNRQGYGASLRAGLLNSGLELEVKARRSKLIEPRAFQKDRFDYIELTLEIPYADF
jgi:hypothetical protein